MSTHTERLDWLVRRRNASIHENEDWWAIYEDNENPLRDIVDSEIAGEDECEKYSENEIAERPRIPIEGWEWYRKSVKNNTYTLHIDMWTWTEVWELRRIVEPEEETDHVNPT